LLTANIELASPVNTDNFPVALKKCPVSSKLILAPPPAIV
jgi:hypothetical protein